MLLKGKQKEKEREISRTEHGRINRRSDTEAKGNKERQHGKQSDEKTKREKKTHTLKEK